MLTNVAIKSAPTKEKPYKLNDALGLYVLIKPNGSKLFRRDYKYNGKYKTLSIGQYPAITLENARKINMAAKELANSGIDPSNNKISIKQSNTKTVENGFEIIAREWWHVHMSSRADSYKFKVIRYFELYAFPWIGKIAISELKPVDILSLVKRIEKQNKVETAHRVLTTIGRVFRYAVQTSRAERDITSDLKGALVPASPTHLASLTEPKDVSILLNAFDEFSGTFTVQCALNLAPMLFVRPGELRQAEWEDVDLEARVWKYIITKSGEKRLYHIVPLSTQACKIFTELHAYSGDGDYVFRGLHNKSQPMSNAAVNAAIRRLGYCTKTQITGHGFRAMARTLLHEELHFDPNVIEHQLAHSVPDILGAAYNRTKFIKQRIEMMQTWSDYLDELKYKKFK